MHGGGHRFQDGRTWTSHLLGKDRGGNGGQRGIRTLDLTDVNRAL